MSCKRVTIHGLHGSCFSRTSGGEGLSLAVQQDLHTERVRPPHTGHCVSPTSSWHQNPLFFSSNTSWVSDMDCVVIIFGRRRGKISPRARLPLLDSTCTKSHNALLVFGHQEKKFIEGNYDDFIHLLLFIVLFPYIYIYILA